MSSLDTLKKLFEGIRDERRKNSNTAERIGSAFLSLLSYTYDNLSNFLRKDTEDIANKCITFLEGAHFGDYISSISGSAIDKDGNAEFMTAIIRELLRSVKFIDGIDGEGWQLWIDKLTGLSSLTIDKITIRQTLVALEYLIQKVRSVNGQIVVSAANGKIKEIVNDGDNLRITFEQNNEFVAHDLIRCAEYSSSYNRSYWVEISSVEGNSVVIPAAEFTEYLPKVGDECVLMGNSENKLRQNLILISATEDGMPRIEVLDDVKDKNFYSCMRVRLGNLDGISDSRFPADNQPHGNGLYGDNVYLRGTFLLSTGEDILTKFEVTEGKINAAIEGLRQDFTGDKGYLNNPSFANGMDSWTTDNQAIFFLLGTKWIWANNKVLSCKGNFASVTIDEGRTVVYIKNNYILQQNQNLRSLPTFRENDDGTKESIPVYLSFFYKVKTEGKLKIEFINVDKTGFRDFVSLNVEENLEATTQYRQYSCEGYWNGTGDFKLTYTGEIYIYMLVLSTDRIDSLVYKYKTLFEQSEKIVKIASTNFDADGHVLSGSQIVTKADMNLIASGLFDESGNVVSGAGLVTSAEMNKLYAFDADGNLVSMIEQTAVDIKISAENISFEGHVVTANGNFKILEDGSIEANGNFVSQDTTYGNSIIINAASGSFKMIGPSNVTADGLPASDFRKDLYALEFLTDTSTLSRYASIKLWGDDILTINPYNGFYLVNPLGKAYCHLTKDYLEFRNESGDYAVYDITGYHK